jgi:hypothetical protein
MILGPITSRIDTNDMMWTFFQSQPANPSNACSPPARGPFAGLDAPIIIIRMPKSLTAPDLASRISSAQMLAVADSFQLLRING